VVSSTQSLFLFTRIRVESTSVWLNENKKQLRKEKQKAKHDPGTCRSEVYVYYDVYYVFKTIF
jgi:hypothetical protein